jgi:hypothetical protein
MALIAFAVRNGFVSTPIKHEPRGEWPRQTESDVRPRSWSLPTFHFMNG